MKKLAAISLVLAMTAASLAGCGSTANTAAPAESEAAETPAATTEETTDTAADTVAADGKVYNIGICQLVQHEALDAATQGFQDALTELLGEENVKFDLQNASGDSATCATIVNQFVSSASKRTLASAFYPPPSSFICFSIQTCTVGASSACSVSFIFCSASPIP